MQNAIDLAQALGLAEPRVAILSAVETVTEKIRSTLDAAALCKMADRRQITGAIVDGPLAFDNAVSEEAAKSAPHDQKSIPDTSFQDIDRIVHAIVAQAAAGLSPARRFRFDLVGDDITQRYGAAINGKFSDEIELCAPINQLTSQCRATIERRAPTYFRYAPVSNAQNGGAGYSRLILPLWGNGRIEMLRGAIVGAG